MRRFIICLLLLQPIHLPAQKPDAKLQRQIENLLQGFHGTVGVFVHDLKHNKTVAVNADTVFPTASIVKMPILLGIMHNTKRGT